ncbi:pH-sensitive chloride channel 2-like [Periplaneta americana]|uniref:pH-sensitive chloride channel 2-like n=1 Tax=Periplaneta americana TaxID=6978 RepID=UPI0037E70F5D
MDGREVLPLLLLCALVGGASGQNAEYGYCSSLKKVHGHVSTYGLLKNLTESCRYSYTNPPGPLNISTRAYIYNSQAVRNLRYNLHMLLQFQYKDPRLAYHSIAPDVYEIIGGEELQNMIWTPHIYLVNDQKSAIMGSLNKKDILISIHPDGTVVFAQRLKTTLICWMKLHKFPFDEQRCPLLIESWVYNSEDLLLHWEDDNPVSMAPHPHMSEYYIASMWTNTSEETAFKITNSYDHRHSFGSYSALMVTFHLRRQVGFYVMDYYVPSMLLVFISWVSFWLDASAISGRIGIGISTMLTFIALSSKTGSALTKVSYIMASEVWFIVCTTFIIGSLVEFAFVNTIWRRRRNVELKKVNSKYIFKSTLTPKQAMKELGEYKATLQRRASSPPHLVSAMQSLHGQIPFSFLTIPRLVEVQEEDDEELEQVRDFPVDSTSSQDNSNEGGGQSFTTMTPQQITKWIDTKSRFMFPIAFLIFNILYWGFIFVDVALKNTID